MKEATRERRRAEILAAAYDVLIEKGYRSTSMLEIAKRARASNETLYAWFGSKQRLVQSMVEDNARNAARILDDALSRARDPISTLEELGPELLKLVTSERVVALNRAAAADADETGALGRTIAKHGRNAIVPRIAMLLEQARDAGLLDFDDTAIAAETYISLLIGDLQIRRVIGALAPLSRGQIKWRAVRAKDLMVALHSPGRPLETGQ